MGSGLVLGVCDGFWFGSGCVMVLVWFWSGSGCGSGLVLGPAVLTELVLGPVAAALSRARATITLLFSPAQWTTIWLWESFRLA